jgi:hypothetical protein
MTSAKGDLIYASEKIGTAVDILATTDETLQQRLLNAYMTQGHYALPMGPGQAGIPMSDDLIQRLETFDERMSCRPAEAGEGTFAATILAFTSEEASDAARELTEINHQIASELAEHEASRSR